MDRKNILILSLSASAFALLLLLVLLQLVSSPQQALAAGQQNGGDYILTTARTVSGEDSLWVLDGRSRNVGIYQYDNNLKRLELRRVFPVAPPPAIR
ncbi:MAG: hypothetical protein WC975_01120 [Phycisphaerae bacterium]